MESHEKFVEELALAWVRLTGALKNTRIPQGMIYNEAVVMLLAYHRYLEDGRGMISFKEITNETKMLKSLVNRTIDSLVGKGLLMRLDGEDKRTTFVCLVPEKLGEYLEVHKKTISLVENIVGFIGEEDAHAFVRIAEKISAANPLNE